MVDAWIILTRLNADLLALAAKSVDLGCELMAAAVAWTYSAAASRTTDLKALGLDHLPASRGELRSAYRRAAKAAHPDAGGSAEAFLAVSAAFRRLTGSNPRAA